MTDPPQPTIDSSSVYVGFVGDPNGRGTASLVVSCLLTLILCVWSALHLNLPHQGESRFKSLLVYARWILAGVYAPELVVFTAWRQWSSAKLLGDLVKELRDDQAETKTKHSQSENQPPFTSRQLLDTRTPDKLSNITTSHYDGSGTLQLSSESQVPRGSPISRESQVGRRQEECSITDERNLSVNSGPGSVSMAHDFREKNILQDPREWTMTHNFFGSTGGFVFEIGPGFESDPERGSAGHFLPPECPRRLTLTARGMALLARCGRLPNIAKAEITDKSKANDLAKALVMIQASWMLVQVLARLIARLPVTLLEVNTIAHV